MERTYLFNLSGLIIVLLLIPFVSAYSFTHSDGLTFETNRNGIIKISDERRAITHQGFMIEGTIGLEDYRFTSEEFIWTWSRRHEVIEEESHWDNDSQEWVNINYTLDTFTAYNNNPNFNWTQEWMFDNRTDVKMKHIITNKLGVDITNTKIWYIHSLPRNMDINFNSSRYDHETTYHFEGNFNNLLPRVQLGELTFFYHDLVNSSFTVSDVYIGDGSILGYSDRRLLAIGITKGSGIFRNGTTIVLDPLDTGYIFPTATEGQWTNHARLKISDDSRAEATAVGQITNTSGYTFDIPDSAEIVGIEVRLEGRCFNPFCAA